MYIELTILKNEIEARRTFLRCFDWSANPGPVRQSPGVADIQLQFC